MTSLLLIILAIWLAKAICEIWIGFFQILTGLLLGLLGVALYVASHVAGLFVYLWQTAFSPNND